MRTRKKSNHQTFVEAWCLEHEITPEMIDERYTDHAREILQNAVRLIPGQEYFRAGNPKNFGEWVWRSTVIKHFIDNEDEYRLFILRILHKNYEFLVLSHLASEDKWHTLHQDVMEDGEKLFSSLQSMIRVHLLNVANGSKTILDVPEGVTYLQSFLATRLYSENSDDSSLVAALTVDERGVWEHYEALFTDVYMLNIYCNLVPKGNSDIDNRIIKSCKRTTDYLLCKQPKSYAESFGQITSLRF